MRALIGSLAIASALLVAGQNAAAQDSNRWAPWLGCWDRVSQDIRETSGLNGLHDPHAVDIVEQSPPRVCVTATGDNQVTLATTVPGQPASDQTVIADGIAHPVAEPGCQGTEQAEWSTSGRRLFARAEVTCEDRLPRSISGLALITADDVWIDIRSFQAHGQLTTRVSRYRRVDPSATPKSPSAGRATLSAAEVKEASAKVSESVLEAAVMEAGANVRVSRATLVNLADAGVPPKVLDVLVALAYPEHFIVERANGISRTTGSAFGQSASGSVSIDLEEYSYTGLYYPAYYYSPFSYAPIGPYQPIYIPGGGGGGVIIGGGPVVPPPAPIPRGTTLAIQGQGYTRIRPNDAPSQPVPRTQSANSGNSTGGSVSPGSSSGNSGGSAPSSSSAPSGGSSSSGGSTSASPGGFSGSGGDTGRTAQPR